jgi:hypothetical protein
VHVQLRRLLAHCTGLVWGRLTSAVAEAVATLTAGVTDSRQSGEDVSWGFWH